jgi:hypothetical protein
MCGLGMAPQMYPCPTLVMMQCGKEALSLWQLEVVAARSSSWHETDIHPGHGSHCNESEFLAWKKCLLHLGGCGGFLTRLASSVTQFMTLFLILQPFNHSEALNSS